MLQKLAQTPAIARAVSYYDQLSARDQKALQLLALALGLFILYFALWRPVHQYEQNQAANLAQSRALMSWLKAHETEARNLARNQSQQSGQGGVRHSLMTTITSSAKQAGIPLARFEPSGQQGMRIWLEDAPFNQVASWLEQLNERYGVRVDQAAIQRGQNPGLITAHFKLQL